MTAKVDNKKRITLKEAMPGQVFDIQYLGAGHFKLARMVKTPEPAKTPVPPAESGSPDSGK